LVLVALQKKHLILTSPVSLASPLFLITPEADSNTFPLFQHPSPLSAHRGFFGNGHFKKVNDWLEQKYGGESSTIASFRLIRSRAESVGCSQPKQRLIGLRLRLRMKRRMRRRRTKRNERRKKRTA